MQQGWSHEVSVVGQERCGAGAAELSDRGVSAPIAISRSYKDDETSPMNLQCVSGTNQAGLEAGAGMATRAATLRWCQFVVYTRCIQCSRGQGADGAVPALVLGVRRAPRPQVSAAEEFGRGDNHRTRALSSSKHFKPTQRNGYYTVHVADTWGVQPPHLFEVLVQSRVHDGGGEGGDQ